MALPRVAASPLPSPLSVLAFVATVIALVALAPAPAASSRLLQARPVERGWPVSGALVERLAARARRSPREQMEAQEDGSPAQPVDPEQKPSESGGWFQNAWKKFKDFAKKAVEMMRDMMEAFGFFDQGRQGGRGGAGGRGGGGGNGDAAAEVDNAETMSPDRLQNEDTTER